MSEVIQDLEQRRWQAMIDVDLSTLDLLLHPNLRYTHSTAAVDTKESYLQALETGLFDYREVDNTDVEIQSFRPRGPAPLRRFSRPLTSTSDKYRECKNQVF